jgi:hypothetical protein
MIRLSIYILSIKQGFYANCYHLGSSSIAFSFYSAMTAAFSNYASLGLVASIDEN